MRTLAACLLLLVVAGLAPADNPVPKPDVIVVCPPAFRPALQPWLADRRAQSLSIQTIAPERTAVAQQDAINKFVNDQTTSILLVGDAPVFGQVCGATEIPIFHRPTTVTGKFNSTATLATDLPYAGGRDIAVGRLPVRTPAELSVVVDKILASDHSRDFGPWRSRLELVGGVGGFGVLIDTAIESTARTILTSSLPASTRPGVLYGSPGHRFYPTDQSFRAAVVDRYRRGCRFWIYAGHGRVTALDRVPRPSAENPAGGPPVLDAASADQLTGPHGSIALMLACFNGAVDAPPRCLAERMLTTPGGPVAVIAGTRVTMPYGNSMLSLSLINQVYERRATTLGKAWRGSIAAMTAADPAAHAGGGGALPAMLGGIAAMMHGDAATADAERIEHAALFQLLGDPTMKLHPPAATVALTAKPSGDAIGFELTSPIPGHATVRLDHPLGVRSGSSNPNDTEIAKQTVSLAADEVFTGRIDTGDLPAGHYNLTVHLADDSGWAAGAAKIYLAR